MAVGFRWRWPALSRRRLSPACRGPVSPPRSSNRTCGFPASGSPTGFTAWHTADGHFRLVSRDNTVARINLRLEIELSLKPPDAFWCCQAHRQSPILIFFESVTEVRVLSAAATWARMVKGL